MLEFGNKEYRNLQQQVGKNKEDIETLKSGIKISFWVAQATDLTPLLVEANYGKYAVVGSTNQKLYVITKRANGGWIADNLGDWPAGIEGPQGEQGDQGDQGPKGNSIYGTASSLPQVASYELGDFYLLTNGNLYKCVEVLGVKSWVLQCSLRGPQGIEGPGGDEVQANPGSATDVLTTIGIDGINYSFAQEITATDRAMLNNLETNTEFDTSGNITFGAGGYFDGNLDVAGSASLETTLGVDGDATFSGDVTVDGGTFKSLGDAELHGITNEGETYLNDYTEINSSLYVDDTLNVNGNISTNSSIIIGDESFIVDSNDNQVFQGKLTAGTNITIDANNVISASGGGGGGGAIIDFSGGITQALKQQILAAPGSLITKDDEIWVPQYTTGEGQILPAYYHYISADENVVYWMHIDWDNLSIEDSGNYSIGQEVYATSLYKHTTRFSALSGGYLEILTTRGANYNSVSEFFADLSSVVKIIYKATNSTCTWVTQYSVSTPSGVELFYSTQSQGNINTYVKIIAGGSIQSDTVEEL